MPATKSQTAKANAAAETFTEAQVMAEAGQRAEEAAAAEQEKTEEAKARDETEQKREEAHEANEDKLVVDHSRKFEADGSDQAIKFSVSEVHAYPEGGMGIWDLSHLSEDARKAGVAGLVMDRHGLHLYVLERWSPCAVCVGGYYTGCCTVATAFTCTPRIREDGRKCDAAL